MTCLAPLKNILLFSAIFSHLLMSDQPVSIEIHFTEQMYTAALHPLIKIGIFPLQERIVFPQFFFLLTVAFQGKIEDILHAAYAVQTPLKDFFITGSVTLSL